jgi:CMP/dCMP kinase
MTAMQRKIITVDGLAGSGKSTLAKLLADKLGFVHLNSGLLYRAVAVLALQAGVDLEDVARVEALIAPVGFQLVLRNGVSSLLVDGIDLTSQLATAEAGAGAGKVGRYAGVRKHLIEAQRHAFPGQNLVAEGRDMGTIIFPEAQVKFFVSADIEVRAERRYQQLCAQDAENGAKILKKQLRASIVERDRMDSERALAPTKAAPGAVLVDNSGDPLTVVLQKMYDSALKIINPL